MLRLKRYLLWIFVVCIVTFSLSFTFLTNPAFKSYFVAPPKRASSIINQRMYVAPVTSSIYSKLLSHVVKVNNLMTGGSGSGVIIWSGMDKMHLAHTFIITNQHVLPMNSIGTVEVYRYLGFRDVESVETFPVRTVVVNTEADLALIEILSTNTITGYASFVNLDDYDEMQLYNDVYIVGCGLGRPPFISDGKIITFDKETLVVNGFSVWGCSGGGVFDSHGRLVSISCRIGMATVADMDYPITDISVSIPVNVIYDWLLATNYKFIIDPALGSIDDVFRIRRYY